MTETELYQAGKRYQNREEDMSSEAKAMEEAYIKDLRVEHNMKVMLRKCKLWPESIDPWDSFIEGLLRGTWQAKYGFYREMREEDFNRGNQPIDEES